MGASIIVACMVVDYEIFMKAKIWDPNKEMTKRFYVCVTKDKWKKSEGYW